MLSASRQGSARTYRGCDLPEGMTQALADKLERMLVGYVDEAPEFRGVFPLEMGVKIFEAIAETPGSTPSR